MSQIPVSITYSSEEFRQAAENLSKNSGYPLVTVGEIKTALMLNYTDNFVELCDLTKNIRIHIDFLSGDLAHRQQYGGGRGQSIAKAVGLKQGVKPPSVIDATAGLAKDAYVLACLGCPVTLLERSAVIAELIKDAINRAKDDEHFQSILNTGFSVINKSSIDYLTQLHEKSETDIEDVMQPDVNYPDVIYLDPMYPDRKKSASVKKNMQILQSLLGKDEDTEALLNVSLKVAKKRVVVKRPKGADNLSNINPTYQVNSKKTRYDIYIIHN